MPFAPPNYNAADNILGYGGPFNDFQDGYSVIIGFDLDTAVYLYEKEVTIAGWEGGAPIDTSTMRHLVRRSQAPRSLIQAEPLEIRAAYNPLALAVSSPAGASFNTGIPSPFYPPIPPLPSSILDGAGNPVFLGFGGVPTGNMADMLNINQGISQYLPDGTIIYDYGWIRRIKPRPNREGEQPEVDVTIEWSGICPPQGGLTGTPGQQVVPVVISEGRIPVPLNYP